MRVALIADARTGDLWREAVVDWLLAAGCLYFLAWGEDCEVWHDAMDGANLRESGDGDIPGDRFVMTTWHETEPLSNFLWFAKFNAVHPAVPLARTLLLHLAAEPREEQILAVYRSAR